jgi:hypothetical protein
MILDLHCIRHHEVDRMVENFILMNQNSLPLTIICGNSKTMIDLVNTVVERIGCKTHSFQYGKIIIRELT